MSAFDQIIGYESVKEKLQIYSDCLANPKKYKAMGVKVPTGVIIAGEPGLGKTLMAKCLMEESGRKSYVIRKVASDGDFIDYMREIVEEAAKNAPSIVLFDDIDKFANEDDDHKNAEEYIVIQALIDEYAREGVFFIATANRKRSLPDSLLRSGRFDSHFRLSYPSQKDSEIIMDYYLSKQKLAKDVDKELIIRVMQGSSCADLESLINDAGIYAAFKGKKRVDQESFMHVCLKKLYRSDAVMSENQNDDDCFDDMRRTAVHEIGHALVAEVMDPSSVNLVTVLRNDYSNVGGVTSLRRRKQCHCQEEYEKQIIISLAGKAAAEVVLGETDTGCDQDIWWAAIRTGELVEDYNEYGFYTGWDPHKTTPWCGKNNEQVIAFELERYYQMAKRIICKNRELFDAMLKELEEKKLITFRDIDRIKEGVNQNEN